MEKERLRKPHGIDRNLISIPSVSMELKLWIVGLVNYIVWEVGLIIQREICYAAKVYCPI